MKTIVYLWMLVYVPISLAQTINIYVNVPNNSALTLSKWSATLEHLQKKLPQYSFKFIPIKPKDIEKVKNLLSEKKIDFLLTQALIYSELEYSHHISRILTLSNAYGMTKFGSVFITHKGTNIKTLGDIEGKKIVAVAPMGFGGWLIAYNELYEQGIDPLSDEKVHFLGSHEKIVKAIINKDYEVGIIRTGMLEELSSKGLINLDDLFIINEKQTPYPLRISTKLYPEWAFAVANHVNNEVSSNVFKVLVAIEADDKAAKQGQYTHWHIAEDYSDVDALLKKFHLAQYKNLPRYKEEDVINIVVLVVIVMVLLFNGGFFYFRYRLAIENEKILKDTIAKKVVEVKKKEEIILIQSRQAIMGELLSTIAHQWRQPLTAISLISSKVLLKKNEPSYMDEKLEKDMKVIIDKSYELSDIINNFSSYFKPNKEKVTICIHDIVDKLLAMIEKNFTPEGIEIQVDLSSTQMFETYMSDLLQILLNLMTNAKEVLIENKVEDPWIRLVCYDKDGKVYIEVHDNGGGVVLENQYKVFDPYFSTKAAQGRGVGLYMSRTITEKHLGGTLEFENEANGACFTLSLPLK